MNIPLTHILSKTFLRPREMPETAVAFSVLHGSAIRRELLMTRYYRLRTGRADWNTAYCGNLPHGLDQLLAYWVTPFAHKPRLPVTRAERWWRTVRFPLLYWRFTRIIRAIAASPSGWIGPPAHGILLVDGKAGREVCILLDGHHRVGALAALGRMDQKIPVEIPEGRWFDLAGTIRAGEGRFSYHDSCALWAHCFERRYSE